LARKKNIPFIIYPAHKSYMSNILWDYHLEIEKSELKYSKSLFL